MHCVWVAAQVLRGAGVMLKQLLSVGFQSGDLADAGYKVKDLADEKIGVKRISALGFPLKELKVRRGLYTPTALTQSTLSPQSIHAHALFSLLLVERRGLQAGGFGVAQLKDSGGFNTKELRSVGFSYEDLKRGGYDPERSSCPPS